MTPRELLANELDVQFNAANQSHRMRWLAVADLVIAKVNAARNSTDSDATTASAAAEGSSLEITHGTRSTES